MQNFIWVLFYSNSKKVLATFTVKVRLKVEILLHRHNTSLQEINRGKICIQAETAQLYSSEKPYLTLKQ